MHWAIHQRRVPDGGVVFAEFGIERGDDRFARTMKAEIHPPSDVDDEVAIVTEDETAFTRPEHLRGMQADDGGCASCADSIEPCGRIDDDRQPGSRAESIPR